MDILDYCTAGVIGNTCTSDVRPLYAIDQEDNLSIANGAKNAWLKAINEYQIATMAMFYENDLCNTESTSCVPAQFNSKCNTVENFQKLSSLFYGPDGFIEKYKTWQIKREQWWNCVTDPVYKLNGIHSYSDVINSSINTTYTWEYSIDYTNYQTPDKAKYLEYRTAMGNMMQSLKQLMIAGMDHPFTEFNIPTI